MTSRTAPETATMKTLRFGIEIETVGLDRAALAAAVARTVGGTVRPGHNPQVLMADGRIWNLMHDGSLSGTVNGEIVTPILTYADIEMVQNVVRAVRHAGAKVDASCGIHIHVGVEGFDVPALIRLAKLTYQQEELIVKALGVTEARLNRYTRKLDEAFIKSIDGKKITSREELARLWYAAAGHSNAGYAQRERYNSSRYRGLNMHSVWFRGTAEFRYFEATLHAGQVKAYVQLVLALAAKALTAKSAVARQRTFNAASAKYDFRVFLLRLGLIGEEFKTARQHLLGRLEGSAAWKNGRPELVVRTTETPASTDE